MYMPTMIRKKGKPTRIFEAIMGSMTAQKVENAPYKSQYMTVNEGDTNKKQNERRIDH
jgi:hypothetical protein